jgi:hypothetical protein
MVEDGRLVPFLKNTNAEGDLSGCMGESEPKVNTIKLLATTWVKVSLNITTIAASTKPLLEVMSVEPGSIRAWWSIDGTHEVAVAIAKSNLVVLGVEEQATPLIEIISWYINNTKW